MGRTDRRGRMAVLLLAFLVVAGIAVARLGQLQVTERASLTSHRVARGIALAPAAAIRGRIVDRHGTPLAQTVFVDKLVVDPDLVDDDAVAGQAAELASILGRDEAGRVELETALRTPDRSYVVLARELTAEQSQAVRAGLDEGRLTGLTLEPQQLRLYPREGGAPGTTLASQLLGFVSDGHGRYGIEQSYDDVLTGADDRLAGIALPGGADLGAGVSAAGLQGIGQEVRLTLDADLQLAVEKRLLQARDADKAVRVSAIVLDPWTGEVLAWASVPGYDATNAGRTFLEDKQLLSDPIASAVYEPGSVMKMFTAAAALGNGTVTPRTKVLDSRVLRFGSHEVNNADGKAKGWIPFEDVIGYSRNVATSKVALHLAPSVRKAAIRLYRAWQDFGIGRPTGVDVANEVSAAGFVPDPRKTAWGEGDLATRSFGQGVAATQVQLAAAFAAMVNGGHAVRPHLRIDDTDPQETGRRVVDPELATQLRDLLLHVTTGVEYYAPGTLVEGYQIGGKTGTAQIWQDGQYLKKRFNFSFVGFVGGDRPEAVMAVRIENARPKVLGPGDLYLPVKSFELARGVALDVIRTLRIPPAKDPWAGRPEPGSKAARLMDPDWRATLRRYRAEVDRQAERARRDGAAAAVAIGDG